MCENRGEMGRKGTRCTQRRRGEGGQGRRGGEMGETIDFTQFEGCDRECSGNFRQFSCTRGRGSDRARHTFASWSGGGEWARLPRDFGFTMVWESHFRHILFLILLLVLLYCKLKIVSLPSTLLIFVTLSTHSKIV